ncbi:hypothetical protein ACUXV3_03170 [Roseobacteraceae bacterium NS-SX3]
MSRLGFLTSAGAMVALCASLAFPPQAAAHGSDDDLARALVGIIALGAIAKSLDNRHDRRSHRAYRYHQRPHGFYRHHGHRHHVTVPRHRHGHYKKYRHRSHRGHYSSPFYYGH